MAVDILPDCRTKRATGIVRSVHGNLVPVYCGNCGTQWGMVGEKHITFAFVLCDKCEQLGDIAHFYKEPDAVFWERVADAEREERAKESWPETVEAFLKALANPSSVVAKLAKEWEKHALKTT
jgi:NAD-dependent SIR2 family protein deacetylase